MSINVNLHAQRYTVLQWNQESDRYSLSYFTPNITAVHSDFHRYMPVQMNVKQYIAHTGIHSDCITWALILPHCKRCALRFKVKYHSAVEFKVIMVCSSSFQPQDYRRAFGFTPMYHCAFNCTLIYWRDLIFIILLRFKPWIPPHYNRCALIFTPIYLCKFRFTLILGFELQCRVIWSPYM